MEIRRSYDRLISTIQIRILLRRQHGTNIWFIGILRSRGRYEESVFGAEIHNDGLTLMLWDIRRSCPYDDC